MGRGGGRLRLYVVKEVCIAERASAPCGFHVNTHGTEHDGEVVVVAVRHALLLHQRSLSYINGVQQAEKRRQY